MAYQKDISAILGVSIATVSKALLGYPDVSEETRRKVIQTAEDIDYRCRGSGAPGAAEASLKKHGAVGVLIPEAGKELRRSEFKKEVVLGIVEEAAERGIDVVIMDCKEECGNMSCLGKIAARKVDGVCLLAERRDIYNGRFAELFDSRIPLVSVGQRIAGHISVGCDQRENIRLLLGYLRDKGHRNLAYLGDLSLVSRKTAAILGEEAKRLEMGFKEEISHIAEEGCLKKPGEEEEKHWRRTFDAPEGVTCVIVGSGREAGVLAGRLKKAGIRVPQDLSLAVLKTEPEEESGVEGARAKATGIDRCPSLIGRKALEALVRIVEHPEEDTGEEKLVCGKVSERGTVAERRTVSERKPAAKERTASARRLTAEMGAAAAMVE